MSQRDNAGLASAVLLFALTFASSIVPPPLGSPKLAFFGAFALYAAAVAFVPSLRASARAWLRVGATDRRAIATTLAISMLSVVALVLYDRLAQPDVSDLRTQLPRLEGGQLLAFGFALALVNAFAEEVAYRGVLQHALESELGAGTLALVLQGAAFAAPHYGHGFPRGPVGLVLTCIYGVALGLLRRWARGLAMPFAAHLVADLTIFAIVSGAPGAPPR